MRRGPGTAVPRSCLFYRSVARKIDWIAWCAGLGVNVVPVTCRDSGFPKNNQPGAVREAPACCSEALQVEWSENSAAELGDLFSAPFSSLSMSLVSVALPREVPRAGDALRGGLGAVLPPPAPLPEPSVPPGAGECLGSALVTAKLADFCSFSLASPSPAFAPERNSCSLPETAPRWSRGGSPRLLPALPGEPNSSSSSLGSRSPACDPPPDPFAAEPTCLAAVQLLLFASISSGSLPPAFTSRTGFLRCCAGRRGQDPRRVGRSPCHLLHRAPAWVRGMQLCAVWGRALPARSLGPWSVPGSWGFCPVQMRNAEV